MENSDLCEGCLRTVAEITEWREASDERRREILAAVAERKAEEAARRDARFGLHAARQRSRWRPWS